VYVSVGGWECSRQLHVGTMECSFELMFCIKDTFTQGIVYILLREVGILLTFFLDAFWKLDLMVARSFSLLIMLQVLFLSFLHRGLLLVALFTVCFCLRWARVSKSVVCSKLLL
jgi:hypothetical protein